MKTAILGGTFNPIHNGHIVLAKCFADILNIEKVLLIPTYCPPHKKAINLASDEHRLKMCSLSAKTDKRFVVSDIEIKRGGKSYTVETLAEIINNSEYDCSLSERAVRILHSALYLICGSDMFLTLEHWYKANKIFELCTIAAAARGDDNFEIMKEYAEKISKMGAKVVLEKFDIPDISSTEIRNRVKNGQDISGLVGPEVAEYINLNGLYK